MTLGPSSWTAASIGLVFLAMWPADTIPAFSEDQKCPESDSGLSLPNGFSRRFLPTIWDMRVNLWCRPTGTVYVNTWSGVMYGNDTPPPGGFLIALKDTKSAGHADVYGRFGPTSAEGAHGGTGVSLCDLALRGDRRQDRSLRAEERRGDFQEQARNDFERHADHW